MAFLQIIFRHKKLDLNFFSGNLNLFQSCLKCWNRIEVNEGQDSTWGLCNKLLIPLSPSDIVQAASTGAPSAAQRSHPTSEVRGRSREDPMPEGRWPRGATPHPRSGGAAERRYPASEVRAGGQEELKHAPKPEARGDGREELSQTPRPRPGAVTRGVTWSRGCAGAGGPRGAIPH